MEFITNSAKETQKKAAELIKKLVNKKLGGALVLGLVGELGAGKTTFIQGLAKTLKIKERILSPTFVIMKRFAIGDKPFANFYHIDCYRIENPKELTALGFKEIIKDPKNLIVIEWAEKVKSLISKDAVWVEFEWMGEEERKIMVKNSDRMMI